MSEDETKSVKPTKSTKTAAAEGAEESKLEEDTAAPVEEEEETFAKFIWNSQKRELLGRGGKSWALITLFYIVFFFFVFVLFMMSWYVSLMFITADEPGKVKEAAWLYVNGPGLTFRPTSDRETNRGSVTIAFQTASFDSYQFWTKQLKIWFNNIPTGGTSVPSCVASKDTACKVDKDQYGFCAGTTSASKEFGYDIGQPCVLLKLNRRNDFSTNVGTSVVIACEGHTVEDKMHQGTIKYYPGPYIHQNYFPYLGQETYQSPFVMVQFMSLTRGMPVTIVCQAFAKNIKISERTAVGYAQFQVMVG